MQCNDRWPEDLDPEASRSRPGSRRNSASSRRSSLREREPKSPNNFAPHSLTSTPKRVVNTQNLDFTVTGKQILKRSDRANSLPGSYHRRAAEPIKAKKIVDSPKRAPSVSRSQDRFLEDDVSLDLSQVSDFEDLTLKSGRHFKALATSTPKPRLCQKSRSISLQSQMMTQRVERRNRSIDLKSRESTLSYSRDSLYKNSSTASPYRYETDLDYSSVSPEYSGQSSTDQSPRAPRQTDMSPQSQDLQLSSCCVSTWQDTSEMENTKVPDCRKPSGEWDNFWVNYNNSLSRVPMKPYYDQCPTPYRTENLDFGDFDTSPENSHIRSPDNMKNLNNIIRNEGLHLTPRETQNMIKCAHILGNVLSKAIERRSKQNDNKEEDELKIDPEREMKKKSLTLNLRETVAPLEVEVKTENATVSTQTDISLPNTKSAPKIFENILRQLSKTTLIDSATAKKLAEKADVKVPKNNEVEKAEEKAEIQTEKQCNIENVAPAKTPPLENKNGKE